MSVWPLLASQTVPAFQQDWTWPLSRGLALQWLHAFVGLWDPRSLGQGNALPWQTYAVVAQVASIELFGPSTGLAVWIAALEFGAACGCVLALDAFGVRSQAARWTAALFYALSPVAFTRIAAGHLAYLLAYALLPFAVCLACRAIERPRAAAAIALGVVVGVAGSQIQFLAIAWLAVLPLPAVVPRAAGWHWRLMLAAGIAICVQLQALLPLSMSSAPALYAGQPALLSFEYNNSSPLASAPIMLGYFTHYYESHAPAGAFGTLYVLLVASVAFAIVANRRAGIYAAVLVAIGTILTAGLYGPLGPALGWAFQHATYFAVFRDLHYFAALTALGVALALGLGVQRFPAALAPPALALVGWIVLPGITGSELRELLVPPAYVGDTLADMRAAASGGPGRVLWLPAEEPVGLRGGPNHGRDFSAYGPPGNPSVSDDYQNPQLAYALAKLRAGTPDWNALSAMNVRYVVFRDYVASGRIDNFGTGFPMAFPGLSDAGLGRLLERSPRLVLLHRSAWSRVYELSGNAGATYAARANPGARLYSDLGPHDVAVDAPGSPRLHLQASLDTADPRQDWVAGTLGWRYRPWLPDSIYPFVWTLSSRPLAFAAPPGTACAIAAAVPRGAVLRDAHVAATIVRGPWKRYPVAAAADGSEADGTLIPHAGDVTALADRTCAPPAANAPPAPRAMFVFASGYDPGWRVVDRGRLIAPEIANGWMMAWDATAAAKPLTYLPAIAQLAGIVLMIVALSIAVPWARRSDARRSPRARDLPTHR